MRGRVAELRQSGQDIRDMRNDQNTQYKYSNFNSVAARALGVTSNTTTLGGVNGRGDHVVYMFTESNMSKKIHESRHGGQIAREEYNPATSQRYGVADEISAYKAEYSWSGKLQYQDQPAEAVALQRLQAGQDPTRVTLNNMNQITGNVVNSMVDPGFNQIYPPANYPGNLDVWNSN